MAKKNDAQTLAFIKSVRENPCLYDRRTEAFRDHVKKQELWAQLATEYDLPDGIAAASKWRNLRDTYMKAKKKAADGQNEARWVHFDEMGFMDDVGEGTACVPASTSSATQEQPSTSTAASISDLIGSLKTDARDTPNTLLLKSMQNPLASLLQGEPLNAVQVDEPTTSLVSERSSPKRPAKRPRTSASVDESTDWSQMISHDVDDEESRQFGVLVARKLEKIDPALRDTAQMEVLKVLSQYRYPPPQLPQFLMQNLLRNLNPSSDADPTA
ncbi:hypothetical protein AAVH_10148 [Aphelenchoides avenae]|nr:hypothetical protein AAVH_10148 [Aphelenchus avenae]